MTTKCPRILHIAVEKFEALQTISRPTAKYYSSILTQVDQRLDRFAKQNAKVNKIAAFISKPYIHTGKFRPWTDQRLGESMV